MLTTGNLDRKYLSETADNYVSMKSYSLAASYYYDAIMVRLNFCYRGKNTLDYGHAVAIFVIRGKLKLLTETQFFWHPQREKIDEVINNTIQIVKDRLENNELVQNMYKLLNTADVVVNNFKFSVLQ